MAGWWESGQLVIVFIVVLVGEVDGVGILDAAAGLGDYWLVGVHAAVKLLWLIRVRGLDNLGLRQETCT